MLITKKIIAAICAVLCLAGAFQISLAADALIKGQIKELVRGSVEETLNELLEAVGEVFPEAKYQRCTVHFYRNVFSVTPRSKVKLVAKMLKAIHAQ